jgi:hypothetical protein
MDEGVSTVEGFAGKGEEARRAPAQAAAAASTGYDAAIKMDCGSHCFTTPETGGKVDRSRLTQVGRALAHLGVEHIAAYSPQARGRSGGFSTRCKTG